MILDNQREAKDEEKFKISNARENDDRRRNAINLDEAYNMLRNCEVSTLDVYEDEQKKNFEYSFGIKSDDELTKYYTSNKPVHATLSSLRDIAYESQNKCGIVQIENSNSLGEIRASYIDLKTASDLLYICRARVTYNKPASKKNIAENITGNASDIVLLDYGE